jgi:transposase
VETQLAPTLRPGNVVILDNLSSHKSEKVKTILKQRGAWFLFLPPYSPELNAIERLWQVMRDTSLSHRLFTDLNHNIEVCCTTWNTLLNQPGRIRSTCGYAWAVPSILPELGIRGC